MANASELADEIRKAEQEGKYEQVLKSGISMLKAKISTDDALELYEYVAIAALEYGQRNWAEYCIERIQDVVGCESRRLARLRSKLVHWDGGFNKKLVTCTNMLAYQTHDLCTRKEALSFFKQEASTFQYVDMLNRHLNEYCTDYESWHELGEVYIEHAKYEYAIYCFEECLIGEPSNPYTLITLAELHSSIGNYLLAFKLFSRVIIDYPSNARALWGIALLSENLPSQDSKSTKRADVSKQLTNAAVAKLFKMYKDLDGVWKSALVNLYPDVAI